MAYIDQFLIAQDKYDLPRLRDDLLDKMVNDYAGRKDGVLFQELVNCYFDTRSPGYEDKALIEQIYQDVKYKLEDLGYLLTIEKKHRFLVKTREEAEMAMIRRAKWWPRLQMRLLRVSGIAVDTYKLPPSHEVVKAIKAGTAGAERISKAIEKAERKKLPLGKKSKGNTP